MTDNRTREEIAADLDRQRTIADHRSAEAATLARIVRRIATTVPTSHVIVKGARRQRCHVCRALGPETGPVPCAPDCAWRAAKAWADANPVQPW